jgi:betaine-aldehyde dehydrogenase
MTAPNHSPIGFIIGAEVRTDSEETIESTNPANGRLNHEVFAAEPRHVDEAVAVAAEAGAARSWRTMAPHARARILYRIGDLLEANAERLATIQMRENGKVLGECLAQAKGAAGGFRYFAAVCEVLGSEVTPPRGPYLSLVVYEPYGVVGALTPWNSPLTMDAQKVAPALAAGNAVILKPSETTPTTALELASLALEAGLPPGLFNVLPGRGDIGAAVVAHPGVRMVSFTGGTATGRAVARAAADRLAPVALELGGKSPHIIFRDADLAMAVEAVLGGIFEGSGQSCVAGSRLFVDRPVYEDVLQSVIARARSLRVDLPDAPQAEMGPLASFAHRHRVEAAVDRARADGGSVLAGGRRPGDERLLAGAFFQPTVIADLDNASRTCQNEIFGPVLCVLPFDGEEDVIGQANDSAYGLACGIWSADFERAWSVGRAIDAGSVWINTYKQLSISTPFGGFKESGIGREKGVSGVRLYQQSKSVYLGLQGGLI